MIAIVLFIIAGVTLAICGTSIIAKTFAVLVALIALVFSTVIMLITFAFILIMLLTALIGIIISTIFSFLIF